MFTVAETHLRIHDARTRELAAEARRARVAADLRSSRSFRDRLHLPRRDRAVAVALPG